jgi:hypothetical protein
MVKVIIPPDAYIYSFTFTPTRIDSSKGSSDKVKEVSTGILQEQTQSSKSTSATLQESDKVKDVTQVTLQKQPEPSKSKPLVVSLQKADMSSDSIIDKIQGVLKAVDSTLDPVIKTGLILSTVCLICSCIPGIGPIFLIIGILSSFITFLLWVGKLVEDSANAPTAINNTALAEPHHADAETRKNETEAVNRLHYLKETFHLSPEEFVKIQNSGELLLDEYRFKMLVKDLFLNSVLRDN